MQVKLIICLEPSHRGAFEVDITVSVGVNTYILWGRGLNYNMCREVKFFLELSSIWLIDICLTAVQKDALSFYTELFSLI